MINAQHSQLPFIETPQGVFVQHSGWLRITSEFLEAQFPEIWNEESKKDYYDKINEWAYAFGIFPTFITLGLFLFLPIIPSFLIGISTLFVLFHSSKLVYGLRLVHLVTVFNKHFVQVAVGLAVFSYLGIHGMYIQLAIGAILFFLARVGWVKDLAFWYAEHILKQTYRFEQLLIWMMLQDSIRMGISVPGLSEMEARLKSSIDKVTKK